MSVDLRRGEETKKKYPTKEESKTAMNMGINNILVHTICAISSSLKKEESKEKKYWER